MYVIFNNTTKIPLLNLIPGVEGHTALSTSPPFWLPVMPKICYFWQICIMICISLKSFSHQPGYNTEICITVIN